MHLGKYSIGVGDRFALQGEAQLKAIKNAKEKGVTIIPVWNKSNREHITVDSTPASTREEADQAVKALDWQDPYFVDADHINLNNVDPYLEIADFFTIDVANHIGKSAPSYDIQTFVENSRDYLGALHVPGINEPIEVTEKLIVAIAEKYLYAVQEAANVYRYIEEAKGRENFIAEISLDESAESQQPVELFFILKMLADARVKVQNIAPKFTGNFFKGVDFSGDLGHFTKEFEDDVLVVLYAIKVLELPESLKLSIHSGSDKFSIYPAISKIIKKHHTGIHLKTAGTTWLEELTGMAQAGGSGLALAKEIYNKAIERFEELTQPYSHVIDVQKIRLPLPGHVYYWDEFKFVNTLRHNPNNPDYNPQFRQLLHCAYKIAAEHGVLYTNVLKEHKNVIAENVTYNLFERHIKPLFL